MDKKEQLNFIKHNLFKTKKVIVIPEILIKIFKNDLSLAAVFKQLIFWEDKGADPDGWVYKSSKELAVESHQSTDQIDRKFNKLVDQNLIKYMVKKVNGAPIRHYKINHSVLVALMLLNDEKIPITPLQPAESLVSAESRNGNRESAEWKPQNRGNLLLSDSNNIQLQHKDQDTLVETASQPVPENTNIDFIFQYWRNRMGKGKNTNLTDERQKLIKKRLASYPIEDLKQAIDGCSQSEFPMGFNDDNKKYNELMLIFRNDTKMEEFRDQFQPIQSGVKLNGTHQQTTKPMSAVDRVKSDCAKMLAEQQAQRGFNDSVVGENGGNVGKSVDNVVRLDSQRGLDGGFEIGRAHV